MTYVLRNLPDPLWNQFKHHAAAEGWPLRTLFLQLMQEYIAGRVSLPHAPIKKKSGSALPMAPEDRMASEIQRERKALPPAPRKRQP